MSILEMHTGASYPAELAGDAEVAGISLVILDSDITSLAQAFVAARGRLRPDQWMTLRDALGHAREVLPGLQGESWVYFARLYALGQAMLRSAPDA